MSDQFGIWMPPKMWEGNTVYILGGGDSLYNINFSLLVNKRVIGVNNAYFLGEDIVDIAWFGDYKFFAWHRENLKYFGNIVATCCPKFSKGSKEQRPRWLRYMKKGKPKGLDERNGWVAWNRCSGSAAINLAFHLGAKRIVLLAFDMRKVGGKKNWMIHSRDIKHDPFDRFLGPFPSIRNDAERLGVEIINATPGSAITQFPITTLEEVI